MCSFYVSDLHLVTMLLPYVNQKLKAKKGINTILENNVLGEVKTLLSKLSLKESDAQKILNLNWNAVIMNKRRRSRKIYEHIKL